MDITRLEWEGMLGYLGASEEEIADMQLRMGRVSRTRGLGAENRRLAYSAVNDGERPGQYV